MKFMEMILIHCGFWLFSELSLWWTDLLVSFSVLKEHAFIYSLEMGPILVARAYLKQWLTAH
jgi:hypothetical protein